MLQIGKPRKRKQKRTGKSINDKKNRVNNIIKNAKINYHKDILEENATKPEQFWKSIKNLFPNKPKYETTCTKFELDGKMISDKLQIANGFYNFFQTVAQNSKDLVYPLKNFSGLLQTKNY